MREVPVMGKKANITVIIGNEYHPIHDVVAVKDAEQMKNMFGETASVVKDYTTGRLKVKVKLDYGSGE